MSNNELTYTDEVRSKIIFYRKKSGLTQSEVAKRMNISRTTYAYAEKKAERITQEFIYGFAKALNISPDLFLINNESLVSNILKSDIPQLQANEPLILSNKEIRIIKMLRVLPRDIFNEVYESVKNEFEANMDPED